MSAWRLSRLGRAPRLLALTCLGLAAVVAVELTDAPAAPPTIGSATVGPATPPAREVESFSMPPRSIYDDVLARPLFSDTRRPSAFAATAAQHPTFLLVGTVVSQQERSALIRHGQPAHVDHVAEGQSLDGWTVSSIRPDRVVLTNAGARLAVTAKGETSVTAHPEPMRHPSGPLSSVPSPPSKD